MIYTVTTFRNEKGREIEALAEHGTLIPAYVKFIAKGFGIFSTGAQQHQLPIAAEVTAASIEEAFEKYEQAIREKGEAMQKEFERQLTRARLQGRPG